jgi:hypothetical protein
VSEKRSKALCNAEKCAMLPMIAYSTVAGFWSAPSPSVTTFFNVSLDIRCALIPIGIWEEETAIFDTNQHCETGSAARDVEYVVATSPASP